ncbi:MAG: type II secretion system F family protein [Pirellulaceae bacterium]
MKFAHQQGESPGPYLRALSDELPGGASLRLRMLVREMEAGQSLLDAIERVPGLLEPSGIAALRLASEVDRMPAAYDALLSTAEIADAENERPWESAGSECWRLAVQVSVAFVIVSFIVLKLFPIIEQMFIEFDLALPTPTRALKRASHPLSLFGLVGLFVVLIFTLFRLPEIAASLRRFFAPASSIQRYVPSNIRFLALAAFSTKLGCSWSSMVAILSRNASSKMRARLSRVHAALDKGEDPVLALARAGLLMKHEAHALGTAGSREGQSWLLHRMMLRRYQRYRQGVYVMTRTLSMAIMIFVGFVVIWTAIAVLLPLFSLIGALA